MIAQFPGRRPASLRSPRRLGNLVLAPTDHELTVIIPAYNEQSRLPHALQTLRRYLNSTGIDYRVVVADDGSRDATARSTDGLGPRFSTLRLAHRGKGSAVRSAMLQATGQVMAFIDADLPYELTALAQGYQWIQHNECELVLGTRSQDRATQLAGRRLARKVASRAFRTVTRRLVSSDVSDPQCGLKLFSRRSALEIFSRAQTDGLAFDAEVVLLALRLGLVHRRLNVRVVGEDASRVSLVRDALPMLLDVVRARMRWGRDPLPSRLPEGWGRLPSEATVRRAA